MKAQRVDAPVTGAESWTVVDADYFPVDPAERYLAYLTAIERSPHTVRAYAQSLALWCEFLELRQVGWAGASVEDVSGFVTWLRARAVSASSSGRSKGSARARFR